MRILLTIVRSLWQRSRAEREMDDELRFHIEMETAANVARGISPDEARRAALGAFGGVQQAREAIRDVRTLAIEPAVQDVRHALRGLGAHPGFATAAIGMLALGIGITTAMFTVVDALVLRPVPFHQPEQLASVYMSSPRGGNTTVAPAVLRAWQQSAAFAGAESAESTVALVESGGTVVTRGLAHVTPGMFALLGDVRPVRGRLFDPDEGMAGSDDRVLVSEDLWRSLFDRDESIVGRRIRVDGDELTVVGVLPSDFRFPAWDTLLWRPANFDAPPPVRHNARPMAYVRFASGLPRDEALRAATEDARAVDPSVSALEARPRPLAGMVVDAYYERAIPLLAGCVVLMFLVLCANVCSLLLARFTTRRREFSMRAALGASRGRLIRQAFLESTVIGALGTAGGVAAAWGLVTIARVLLPDALLLTTLNPLNLDMRALVITSLAATAGTLVIGLLPAWIGTRVGAGESLRVVDRGGTESRVERATTRTLLVGEIALACTLLVAATLLVRSFVNLATAERGLDPAGVVTVRISLPESAFADDASRAAIAQLLESAVRELPGVRQTSWSLGLPPRGGGISWGEWVSDAPGEPAVDMTVGHYNVSQDFFDLYGIRLLRGRTFEPGDPPEAVVIGERLARTLWPGVDPVGRRFRQDNWHMHVIGVVEEIHYPSLDARLDLPEFYLQVQGVGAFAMLSVRCDAICPDVAAFRQQLGAVHPAVQLHNVQPLEAAYFEQLARPRAAAALAFAFAAIATAAAAGGLFSVLSYVTSRRRREFGIRAALGASPGRIGEVVLREGLTVAGIGILLGSAGAAALSRALTSLQYGVSVADPASWLMVVSLVLLIVGTASWRPARAAMRLDPAAVLRED